VSELTATPSDGKVELAWKPANDAGKEPITHEALKEPHPGYIVLRDGVLPFPFEHLLWPITGTPVPATPPKYTDSTVADGNTYAYQIFRASSPNYEDYSNIALATAVNTAPTVYAGNNATINEGDTFTSSGSFTDPGADTWTATVNYGDGSGVQPLPLAGKSFNLNHDYADNGVYTVTVTVNDDDGGVGTDTASVTVDNVAPTVDAGSDDTINEGDTFTGSGSFTDRDDTWSAMVNYGDGSGVQVLLLTGKSFDLNHDYADNGVYTVTVTVNDDDGGVGTDTAQVTVHNVAPTAVIGSVVQPNPNFILPVVHTLTFNGSFSDPGWLDTHTSSWDFDDGTVTPGTLTEENVQLLSTGDSTAQHAYSAPGNYIVTLDITDDDGGMDTVTWSIDVVPAEESITIINKSVQDLPGDAFKGKANQRKNAYSHKLAEVNVLIAAGAYQEAIDKLQNDLRAKGDGSIDGNSKNDKITDPAAQEKICRMIDDLIAYLQTML
jgi:PKD repeat protein